MNIIVKTTFDEHEIKQQIFDNRPMVQKVTEQIIRLQDEQVIEALIKLGWTPPKHKK